MSDVMMKENKRQNTTTRTLTETLSHEEEKVVRMLHGLSQPDNSQLQFADVADDEVNARSRRMEAELLAKMHGQGPLADADSAPVTVKEKIMGRLQKLDRE